MELKKIASWFRVLFSWGYVLLVLVIIAYSLYQRVAVTTASEARYQSNVIISGSMTPTIPIGSLVISKTVPISQLKKGDVIVFDTEGERLTHRITAISKEKIQTKGDANDYLDAGTVKKIYGKVGMVIPKIGYLFLMLETASGKIALCLTAINLILTDYLLRLLYTEWTNKKEGSERDEKENSF